MKPINSLISFLLLVLLLTSCAKDNLTISVTEPAPITLPSYIKKVGIVNRTMPSKDNDVLDKIDKVLSVEGKNLDKDGAHQAVLGLFNELGRNQRFAEIKIIDDVEIKNPGLGIFPSPLSWEIINEICRENDVDALFILAFYDTDAKIAYNSVPVLVNGPLGVKIPVPEHQVNITTLIKTGWRIYDPGNRVILDEFTFNDTQLSRGKGINPARAAEAVIGRKEAVMQLSNSLGYSYSLRVMPYRIRVSREYFVKGTNNFRIAKRRAQTGDWNGAAVLWQKEVANRKRKVSGRACYNMAIINEINGDQEAAVEWASKAYTDYKNKAALDYLNILKRRIARDYELQYQMGSQ